MVLSYHGLLRGPCIALPPLQMQGIKFEHVQFTFCAQGEQRSKAELCTLAQDKQVTHTYIHLEVISICYCSYEALIPSPADSAGGD